MRDFREIDLWPDAAIPLPAEADLPGDISPVGSALLDQMALQVRLVYILCRREVGNDYTYGCGKLDKWDGGEDRFGSVHTPIWPKVARVILTIKADPMEFIRAQFWAKQKLDGKMPSPTYMLSSEAIARWEDFRTYARVAVCRQLKSDRNAIRNGVQPMMVLLKWPRAAAYQYVIRDRGICASPLYRYVVATREELIEDSSSLHDAALLQYVFQCEIYDAEWGSIVPDTLRTEAKELRSLLGCA